MRGFNLIELLVVMLVVMVLTGMLLPTLATVRENARRVYCKSNLHQIGLALAMYVNDEKSLPYSYYGDPIGGKLKPQDMMAAHRGGEEFESWEGLGLLFRMDYCTTAQCFYCPSHHGKHSFEDYEEDYARPGQRRIFGNYHYAGHLQWNQTPLRPRRLEDGHDVVLVTDGLRTQSDFNHLEGMNVLRADISVTWQDDVHHAIYSRLPLLPDFAEIQATELYIDLWHDISHPEDIDLAPGTTQQAH